MISRARNPTVLLDVCRHPPWESFSILGSFVDASQFDLMGSCLVAVPCVTHHHPSFIPHGRELRLRVRISRETFVSRIRRYDYFTAT